MYPINGPGSTVDKTFTEGNPSLGVPATQVTAKWCNDLQAEIIAVIIEAELEPDADNQGQLLAAILSLIAGGGAAVVAAGVSIADAGDYFSGTNVELALQQLAAKIYAGTFNSNQIRRSIVAVSGAAQQTETTHAENIVQASHTSAITYTVRKDSVLDLPIGTAITIVQVGAGQVTVTPVDGDVTIKKGASFFAKTMEQDCELTLIKVAANTWRVFGQLAAA